MEYEQYNDLEDQAVALEKLKTIYSDHNMTPGMTASVEVKLDRRKIIEFYLLVIDYIKDSFKL